MNPIILSVLCLLALVGLWSINNQTFSPRFSLAFTSRNNGKARRPRYDLVMAVNGVRPSTIQRLKGHTTVLSAKTIDLDKWVIATEKGSVLHGDISHPVSTGTWRIPVLPGSTFKQITIPLVRSLVDTMEAALRQHPSIAWLKDDKIVLHYQDDLRFPDFCAKYGVVVSGPVGKRDKRISRWLRPQALFGYFKPANVKVVYEKRGLVNTVAEDGVAAWVSRNALTSMAEYRIAIDSLDHKASKALRRMARNAKRVELTFINTDGQYKGDALVVDTADYDLLLLEGTAKPELKMTGDVYLSAQVRHTSQMRLDVQTHLNWNANGTFTAERLADWMREYCQHNLDLFDSGESVEIIDGLADRTHWKTDAENLLDYAPYNFILSGGDPKWFAHTTRQVLKSGLTGATRKGMADLSFLVPGRSYHVFPASVGQRAGLNIRVARGEAKLDNDNATIWINNLDAVTVDDRFSTVYELEKFCGGDQTMLDEVRKNSPGLFQIWSGADNDDDIKCLPVHFGGRDKIITGRSPNEVGQHAILNLTEDSDYPEWCGGQSVAWGIDLNTMPAQVAQGQRPTLGLVGAAVKGKNEYDHRDILNAAISMINSSGAVGIQALRAWFEVALYHKLPDNMPAEISEIIDAQVKDFADLSIVNDANKNAVLEMARQSVTTGGIAIPLCRAETFSKMVGDEPFTVEKSWIDELYIASHTVLQWYFDEIEIRAMAARPPIELYKAGMKASDAGRGFKSAWGEYWYELHKEDRVANDTISENEAIMGWFAQPDKEAEAAEKEVSETDFDGARDACLDYIEMFKPVLHPSIMVGGLAWTYAEALSALQPDMPEENFVLRDAAFWQLGPMTDSGRGVGFGDLTVLGLRQAGIIGEVMFDDATDEILVKDARKPVANLTILKLNKVWFNYAQASGMTDANSPSGVKDKSIVEKAKEMVRALDMKNLILTTGYVPVANARRTDVYPCVAGPKGNVIGTLRKDTAMEFIPEHLRVVSNYTEGDETFVVCEEVKA